MTNNTEITEAVEQYAAAHVAHYTAKNLREALELYRDIMNAHPNTQEAVYSRTQIENIVNSVVPGQEILDAKAKLALTHLEREAAK